MNNGGQEASLIIMNITPQDARKKTNINDVTPTPPKAT